VILDRAKKGDGTGRPYERSRSREKDGIGFVVVLVLPDNSLRRPAMMRFGLGGR